MTHAGQGRIPVTLLAGFLGSGKTTLANRILSEQHNQRIAVIVNEFGDVGIDGSLVVSTEDNVVELSNGCICCTVRNDLAETLSELIERCDQVPQAEAFERILIEASGLASPGPAVQTLLVDPQLSSRLQLAGVITMAHAQHIVQQLGEHPEASEQVGYADRIILNHCDQCEPEVLGVAESAIRACNRDAEVMQSTRADVDIATLLDVRPWDADAWNLKSDTVQERHEAAEYAHDDHEHDGHDHETLHTCGVSTLTLRSTVPMDLNRLKMWLLFVSKRNTHDLMRLKGILNCQQHEEPVIIQGVYQWLELQVGRGQPPAESLLVMIGRDLDGAELNREWEECHAR
jgi:G3E family GTPase